MINVEITVRNPSGLHARPAAVFAKAAAGFTSRVRVANISTARADADAKSLIGVLGCGVLKGHEIRISAEGEDEVEAVARLRALVEEGLGEQVEAR